MPAHAQDTFEGLADLDLIHAIRAYVSTRTGTIDYNQARFVLYSAIDNIDGFVHDVYRDRYVHVDPMPCSDDNLTIEHTWPRSRRLEGTPAVSDMHHLFVTDEDLNERRRNYPFGEVIKTPENIIFPVPYEPGHGVLGWDRPEGQPGRRKVFEPPDWHKGNAARAMFYMASVYDLHIPADEEAVLRNWHRLDPVDAAEVRRNAQVSRFQHNRNPFIDEPSLEARIYDF
jgi:hypothetical protein